MSDTIPAPPSPRLVEGRPEAALRLDDLPAFLRFTPVPVRSRRDGWGPELQLRFVVQLARGASVGEAARRLGRSRQSAYALRERAGAQGFAAAWDAAAEFAQAVRAAPSMPGAERSPVELLLVPRYYRGRLIGYVQREDLRGLMAGLRRLDGLAERLEARERRARRRRPGRRPAGRRVAKVDKVDATAPVKAPTSSILRCASRRRGRKMRPSPS